MIIPSLATALPKKERIAALKQEMEKAQGHYNFCAAADFQSPEERRGEADSYKRIHEIQAELARLRGPRNITDAKLKPLVYAVYHNHPVAAVAVAVAKQAYRLDRPHGYGVSLGSDPDDPLTQVNEAVRQGVIAQEKVDQRVAALIGRGVGRQKPDQARVHQEVAEALTRGFEDKHPIYRSMEEFVHAAGQVAADRQPRLLPLAQEVVLSGKVALQPKDVNKMFRGPFVFEPGMLGARVDDYHKFKMQGDGWTQRRNARYGIGRIEEMLRQDLPFGKSEKKAALQAAEEFLGSEAKQCPASKYHVEPLREEIARWQGYGLSEETARALTQALPQGS